MQPATTTAGAVTTLPLALRTGPKGRHVVDLTVLYTPTSGGVRRYLLTKHRWLGGHTRLRHTMLVPAARSGGLPYGLIGFASPAIPFGGGYRVPLRMRALRNHLARLTPDLIEVGDPYHLAWQALRVAHERRVPTIAFCHSDVATLARSWLGASAGRMAARYLADLYARFDKVLAPSALVAERLRDIGVSGVEIQPLGVDTRNLAPQAADPSMRESLGIPERARLLVFAGRLSPEKRTCDLMVAAQLLGPGYHLLLVGGRRMARPAPNVTVLEYEQDTDELARVLASCDAFVHASDQETFGLVVLEAMACGLPVIATRAGALVELVDESVGELFRPQDPADLARAVRALFERDLSELRRAARRRAEAHSWDAAFTRLLGHYTRLMPSTPVAIPRGDHARWG